MTTAPRPASRIEWARQLFARAHAERLAREANTKPSNTPAKKAG